MKAVGLITEYNPFHNGHLYHLEQSKARTSADCAIAVMSGDFVQRGEPAMIDKYCRAKAAVEAGVDLVIELPVFYALSSAEDFALGAIKILNSLQADSLCFGSECGDLSSLSFIANLLNNETDAFKSLLSKELTSGHSFPVARQNALEHILSHNDDDSMNKTSDLDVHKLLSNPNNILGIEYLKALIHTESKIIPHTITRCGTGYNETNISGLPSASSIRAALSNPDFQNREHFEFNTLMPSFMADSLSNCHSTSGNIITIDDFTVIFNYTMNSILHQFHFKKDACIAYLSSYVDINNDLAARIYHCFKGNESIGDFCANVKSKQYTYSRISRAVMHIILNIKKGHFDFYKGDRPPYIRILGFNEVGAKYLSSIRKSCDVPIITKVSDFKELLNDDIYCSHVYNDVVFQKCGYQIKDEYRSGVYIKK